MAKAKPLGKVRGIIASASEPSRNGRKYTEHFWDSIFDSELFKEGLKNKVMIGELWHPDSDEEYGQIHADPNKAAIVLTKVDKKGLDYYGEFDILPTPAGETYKNLSDIGCVFGVSSRGYNDFDANVFDDPSTYELITFDLVAFPGIKSARLHPVAAVAEGFNTKRINKRKIMEKLDKVFSEDEYLKKTVKEGYFQDHYIEKYKNGYVPIEDVTDYIWTIYDGDLDDKYACAQSIIHDFKDEGKVATDIIDQFAGAHNLTDYVDVEESIKAKEDFDSEIQADELDIFDGINDELKNYAIIVTYDNKNRPVYDDGTNGLKIVKTNIEGKKGDKYLVDDIYYDEYTDTYTAIGDWLKLN